MNSSLTPLEHSKNPPIDKKKSKKPLKLLSSKNFTDLPKSERPIEYQNLYYYPSDDEDDDLSPSNKLIENPLDDPLKLAAKIIEEEGKTSENKLSIKENTKEIQHKLTNSEISYQNFINPSVPHKIKLDGEEWNPIIDFASQMLVIPQDTLKSWQNKHIEEFTKKFEARNNTRSMLNLDGTELHKTESEVISYYCLSLVEMMRTHFGFLELEFPKLKYACCYGLPEEIPGYPPPPLDTKVLVLTIGHVEKRQTYPAIAIVPTGYVVNLNDYVLLKDSLEKIGNRWQDYKEFYGVVTNFRTTIFIKYNRDEKKYSQWQHSVNFKECFLRNKSPDKLRNFYKIWFALLYKALEVYSVHTKSK